MDFKQEKNRLREQILAKRDAISQHARIEKSLDACVYGLAGISIEPSTVVSGFFPIRSEIDPRPLMDGLRKAGAALCLPVVIDRETIIFRELTRETELVDTGFGTRGPGDDARILDPELMIMPMSVFDMKGGRIGYGAGHYDRAISRLLDRHITPRLVGMAFAVQEIDAVPTEPHDQPLQAVVTENGYFEISPSDDR